MRKVLGVETKFTQSCSKLWRAVHGDNSLCAGFARESNKLIKIRMI